MRNIYPLSFFPSPSSLFDSPFLTSTKLGESNFLMQIFYRKAKELGGGGGNGEGISQNFLSTKNVTSFKMRIVVLWLLLLLIFDVQWDDAAFRGNCIECCGCGNFACRILDSFHLLITVPQHRFIILNSISVNDMTYFKSNVVE